LLCFLTFTGISRAPWPSIGVTHDIPVNSNSERSFDFIRRSLHDCHSNPQHQACRERYCNKNLRREVPSRLLDVGSEGSQIKLCQPRAQKGLQYVALSHCWGDGPSFTTTTSDIKDRTSSIEWDSLPALFQDAVTVTRELGVQYLWIDALCIIQDSRSDWAKEAARMSSIYEGSYVTIAATTAKNSSERFLVSRAKPAPIFYENTNGKRTILKSRKTLDNHPHPEEKTPAALKGALIRRGWALQEHVLCSRIIHFTSTEIVFECRTAFRCECKPQPKRWPTTPGMIPRVLSSKKLKKGLLWKTWHHIIAQYSRRQLTFPSDKLPAISGIASEFRTATNSKYLAGLWRDNLPMDLLWSSVFDSVPLSRARCLSDYRAPSYSWASLDVPIRYYHTESAEETDLTPAIDIKSAKCETESSLNPLGEVTHASLVLSGYVAEGMLSSLMDDKTAERIYHLRFSGTADSNSPPLIISPDTALVSREINPGTSHLEILKSTESKRLKGSTDVETMAVVARARQDETSEQFTNATVFCLKIATQGHEWITGLVLSPVSQNASSPDPASEKDGGLAVFERLGIFECSFESFAGAKKTILMLE
jgi:hypothetical protein